MNTKAIQQLADATLDKYRNRIRRYVFEALAAEGGGGP